MRVKSGALGRKTSLVVGLTLAADQASKEMVRQTISLCPSTIGHLSRCDHRILLGPLWLVHVENQGSAFGVIQGSLWIWILIAALGMLLIPVYGKRFREPNATAALALGLQVGGALGNVVDRLVFGRVTDFFFPGRWIVYNLADAALLVGTILAVRLVLQAREKAERLAPSSTAA